MKERILVEVRSELPLSLPAPVWIKTNIPRQRFPQGNSFILSGGGEAIPAQRDGPNAVAAMIGPFKAGERKKFELTAAPATAGVSLKDSGKGELGIQVDGQPFTTYHYGNELPRPFFFPVLGPAGKPVTRSFPMRSDVPGETKDHKHHRSLWTAYGEVGGVDDWSEDREFGRIIQQRFTQQASGPVFGGFTSENLWTRHDGAPFMRETRSVRIFNAGDNRRLFNYTVTLEAGFGDVTFGDTKEGGIIAFRVATTMDGNKGGRIENSNGEMGEKACWGKQAAWCDYSGPTDGVIQGIAVMDHPSNFRHPTYWHVRDYGLMGTNYFGTRSFRGSSAPSGEFTLKSGGILRFRYRVLLHLGDAAKGRVADAYHGYIQQPIAQAVIAG